MSTPFDDIGFDPNSAQDFDAQPGPSSNPLPTATAAPVVTSASGAVLPGCVLIGPADSGKTTLLAAIKRACNLPADDGLHFIFTPEPITETLIKDAVQRILQRNAGMDSTTTVNFYPFSITLEKPARNTWQRSEDYQLEMVMTDGAGGFLLPRANITDPVTKQYRADLLQATRQAQTLIFCVDASRPRLELLATELGSLLAETVQPHDFDSQPHWRDRLNHFLRRQLPPTPRRRSRKCLQATRVLLLLTQIDKLCAHAPGAVKPQRHAEFIDPIEQACQTLDRGLLKSLRDALRPDAQFAVTVVSSMGFHPHTGVPFADKNGAPVDLSAANPENILRNWTPFGLRDALYFLATGQCQGQVRQITEASLLPAGKPLEVN